MEVNHISTLDGPSLAKNYLFTVWKNFFLILSLHWSAE